MGGAEYQVIVSRRGFRGWLILLAFLVCLFIVGGICFGQLIFGKRLAFDLEVYVIAGISGLFWLWMTALAITLNIRVSQTKLEVRSIWGSRAIEWQNLQSVDDMLPTIFGEEYFLLELKDGYRPLRLYTNLFANHQDLQCAMADAIAQSRKKPLLNGSFAVVYWSGPYGYFGTDKFSKRRLK